MDNHARQIFPTQRILTCNPIVHTFGGCSYPGSCLGNIGNLPPFFFFTAHTHLRLYVLLRPSAEMPRANSFAAATISAAWQPFTVPMCRVLRIRKGGCRPAVKRGTIGLQYGNSFIRAEFPQGTASSLVGTSSDLHTFLDHTWASGFKDSKGVRIEDISGVGLLFLV